MIWILGGTGEGVTVTDFLQRLGIPVFYSTSTQMGASFLQDCGPVPGTRVPLNLEQMNALVSKKKFNLVIDATHPFATRVSQNAMEVCRRHRVPYLRYERPPLDSQFIPPEAIRATDIEHAVRILQNQTGNILLTVGVKNLGQFCIPLLLPRLYVRVLPAAGSIEATARRKIPIQRIIAVNGPLSEQMNRAIMEEYHIKTLVTKESGTEGGLREKIGAARAQKVGIVIIERPPMSYPHQVGTIGELMEWVNSYWKKKDG